MDIMLVADASGSIRRERFDEIVDFLEYFVNQLSVGQGEYLLTLQIYIRLPSSIFKRTIRPGVLYQTKYYCKKSFSLLDNM